MTVPLVTFEKLAEIVSTCSSCSACRDLAKRLLEEPEIDYREPT